MFILAVFTAVVGERLSRREVVERIPVDRDLLLDFSSALEAELDRLDGLYVGHLDYLVEGYVNDEDEKVKEFAEELACFEAMALFSEKSRVKEFDVIGSSRGRALPEVSVEGLKLPFDEKRAVILPKSYFEDGVVGKSGWVVSPEGGHFVYWSHAEEGKLVAIVIDKEKWLAVSSGHLNEWLPARMEPLIVDSTQFSVSRPGGSVLYAEAKDERESLAALVVPMRTYAGEWLVQAWNGVTVKSYRDPLTLSLAMLLAVIFLLSGYLLYQQQMRSLKLAKQRVSFVNQVSHEFGSPLTNVTLNLDLIAESIDGESVDTRRRLGVVSEEISRLNRMVANVLTFSRMDRGGLELEVEGCDPDEVISHILESFLPALVRRGITIESDLSVGGEVETSSDALSQIVANLISNVEKYAYAGKWMRVTSRMSNGKLIISVEDRGDGVPENAQGRIFRSFERVQSIVAEGSSGTGLGLSIARELAERLGGNLRLLETEKGCHFELSVPCVVMGSLVDQKEVKL
ncbi:MAG: sensor histidine kinase [Akkermansiaceae bacterium]